MLVWSHIAPLISVDTKKRSMARLLLFSLFVAFLFSDALARAPWPENPVPCIADGVDISKSSILRVVGGQRDSCSFACFAHSYGKTYGSVEEIGHRFGIFAENLRRIQSTNSKRLSYTLGVNKFTDLTWEEFQAHHLGAAQHCSATSLKGSHKIIQGVLPKKKDWRENAIVSPVKNQGGCGSCWAFSSTGALEAAYTQLAGKNISLSEQQLVDCAQAFNNFGCSGGLPSQAFEYVLYNGGLDTAESYPYTGDDGVCNFKKENVGVKVINVVNITQDAEDELKNAVGLVRPVSVAFQVIDEFYSYKRGVFTSNNCGSTPMDVNHAVLAVGYGVEKGIPYWLIKNSWGSGWGLNGYFKMEMGKNMCGVATCASYPVVAE